MITLEKLDTTWDSRQSSEVPFDLTTVTIQSKCFNSLRKPETAYDAIVTMVVAMTIGLKLGYTIAQSEKLEELFNNE